MLELVFANLRNRPFRTLISVVGVALGVILVVLFTGLARGMSNDMAKRASNWKAEIVFTRPGGMDITSSSANLSVKYVERLLAIEGVKSVVPVIRYVTPSREGRWGLQQLDGVDWPEFAAMNGMQILKGRAATADDEVILDEREARDRQADLGSIVKIFGNKEYKVAGIFSPPSGSRIKLSLGAMQKALDAPGKCSYILVKIRDGETPEMIAARINQELPGNKVSLTRDLVVDAEQRVPGLKTFLRTLIGLGAFVCVVFVLLSMYTTITERRREIGILKSLGASKMFIVGVIEREALMIGILGTILGFIVSFIAAYVIQNQFELIFEFGWQWAMIAIVLAIGGSLIGALYPAVRAASLDPILVLTNE
jgi:putative ABC transport system permease protein